MILQPSFNVLLVVEENSILTVSPNIKPYVIKFSKRKENSLTLNSKEFLMVNIKRLLKMLLLNKKEIQPSEKRIKNLKKMMKK